MRSTGRGSEGLIYLLFFPGLLFQLIAGLAFEWLDRKLLARFQRRVGPPCFEPVADLIKLISKEELLPKGANELVAALLPLVSLSSVLTAGLYIPIAGFTPFSFEGDLIVIMLLMSVPTLAYYLAGVVSVGIYSIMGGGRSLLQYFSYEVPLIITLMLPRYYGWFVVRRKDHALPDHPGSIYPFSAFGFHFGDCWTNLETKTRSIGYSKS